VQREEEERRLLASSKESEPKHGIYSRGAVPPSTLTPSPMHVSSQLNTPAFTLLLLLIF
jgi:hypothetical protein